MSLTFADQLFQNLESLKDNSYKLDTSDGIINMECSNDGGIDDTFGIYGLDYMIGSDSALTISEKVGDLNLNINKGTLKPLDETTDVNKLQLNMETKQISGSWKIENDNITCLDFNYTCDGQSELPNKLGFDLNYNNNYICWFDKYQLTVNTGRFFTLPTKENIDLNKFSISPISGETFLSDSMNNITIKDTNGNIIWKFNITEQDDGPFKITIPEDGGQAPYYINFCYLIKWNNTFFKLNYLFAYKSNITSYDKIRFYNDKITDNNNNNPVSITTDFDSSTLGIEHGHKLGENHYEFDFVGTTSLSPIHIEYNNGQLVNCYIIKSYLTLSGSDNTFNINLYPVSKPYPALYIHDDRLKGDYKNKLSAGIKAISSTVMANGVICPQPSFIRNTQ